MQGKVQKCHLCVNTPLKNTWSSKPIPCNNICSILQSKETWTLSWWIYLLITFDSKVLKQINNFYPRPWVFKIISIFYSTYHAINCSGYICWIRMPFDTLWSHLRLHNEIFFKRDSEEKDWRSGKRSTYCKGFPWTSLSDANHVFATKSNWPPLRLNWSWFSPVLFVDNIHDVVCRK